MSARRTLEGKRILVTRAREQAGSLVAMLRERGAEPIVVPTLRFLPPTDVAPLAEALVKLTAGDAYDWLVFTSANAVRQFLGALRDVDGSLGSLAASKTAAVGPGTASALEREGLPVSCVAKAFVGEGLGEELAVVVRKSEVPLRFLLPRAEVARDVLPDALRAAGAARVDVVPVYRTEPPPPNELASLRDEVASGHLAAVTFTSSSTVTHLCDALGEDAAALLKRTAVFSIGPVTSETARARGVTVDVEAKSSTIAGLVEAMELHFAKHSTKRGDT